MPDATPISNGARRALNGSRGPSPALPSLTTHQINGSRRDTLQKLRGRHHSILRLLALGISQVDVANALGVSQSMVSKTANSELGKQKLAALQDAADLSTVNVLQEFAELAPVALEVAEDIMLNDFEKAADRLNAVKIILQGAGHTGQHNRLDVNINHVTDDDIKVAKLRGWEQSSVFLEDVEDVEVIDEEARK